MEYENTLDLEVLYLYILSRLPIKKLEIYDQWLTKSGSFEKIYYASDKDLAEFGLGLELIIKFRQIKKEWSVEKLVRSIEETKVQVLPYYNPLYPKILKEIHDPPPVLFYKGKLVNDNEKCVAVVGSRKMSDYGLAVIPRITNPLIDSNITIVSGLAYGVDSTAHAQCVNNGTRTIAVLGTGVDESSVYPRAHQYLAEQILDNHGLLISEQPPYTPGFKQNFIARNRIIAGLSLGVVIVEAKNKSGALLTADYATDFNRSVYAVPGPIYSTLSDGPNELIKNGARLITDGKEILEDLNIPYINATQSTLESTSSFSETEVLMLKCMQGTAITVNSLVQMTKLEANIIMQNITALELRGVIKKVSEGFIKT